MTARAIPDARPELLAEIEAPSWPNATGPEPAFVDGRLFFYGGTGLFEIGEDWVPIERLPVGHDGRTVLPVPLAGGGLGVAWSATYRSHEALVLDATCQPIYRLPLAKTATIVDSITTRACSGALVVGWSGADRTGVPAQSNDGGIPLGEVIAIDTNGPRFTLPRAELLASCRDTLLIARDVWPKESTCGVDVRTGDERWRSEERFPEAHRAEVDANDECFFVVENFRLLDDSYHVVAIDPTDGRERWRTKIGRHIRYLRACGPVIALSLNKGADNTSLILDAATGAIVDERPRPAVRHALFPVLALDHSRVLWRSGGVIVCERHTGEVEWTLPLPFLTAETLKLACADGRIALRRENRIWIYGA